MTALILLRHGQSAWNRDNRFTGWTDVDLTDRGIAEARGAGSALARSGTPIGCCFTSCLKRAIKTLDLVLEAMDRSWLPVQKNWRLNERHYGALQGLNKAETAAAYGADQVLAWRRSWDVPPPALELTDARHPAHDPRYARVPPEFLPCGESLSDTVDRVLPFWLDAILPALACGDVLVAAHGNSLRGLVKAVTGMSEQEVVSFEMPTGQPLLLEMNEALRPIARRFLDVGS